MKVKRIKTLAFLATATALSGCASTGIMKSGEDKFIVSKTSLQVGFGAPTAVYAEITQEAVEFCKAMEREMEVARTDIQHPALGRPGSATLEFRCKKK